MVTEKNETVIPQTPEQWEHLRKNIQEQLITAFRCAICNELKEFDDIGTTEEERLALHPEEGLVCQECVDLYEVMGGTQNYTNHTADTLFQETQREHTE